jgi:endoglucanase
MLRCMNQTPLVRSLVAVCLGCTSILATAKLRPAEPPLHASGHDILDSVGHRVRLTSVNWYGFDQQDFVAGGLDHAPLATIVKEIADLGVNSVRLPWANETLEHNPQVLDYAVKANPQFRRKHAMEVMDAVVARAG